LPHLPVRRRCIHAPATVVAVETLRRIDLFVERSTNTVPVPPVSHTKQMRPTVSQVGRQGDKRLILTDERYFSRQLCFTAMPSRAGRIIGPGCTIHNPRHSVIHRFRTRKTCVFHTVHKSQVLLSMPGGLVLWRAGRRSQSTAGGDRRSRQAPCVDEAPSHAYNRRALPPEGRWL